MATLAMQARISAQGRDHNQHIPDHLARHGLLHPVQDFPASGGALSDLQAGHNWSGSGMGLSNSFMSLGRIVGPIWAGFIFDVNFDYPYLSGTAILFLGFLISLVRVSQGRKETVTAELQPAGHTKSPG